MAKDLKGMILIMMFLTGFVACSSSPKFTNRYEKIKQPPANDLAVYNNVVPVDTVIGVASFYADKFHGRQTSNGEIYDMYGLTAASPTLPPETILRVTNLGNSKSVIVRINDHMPYRPDRIIDLSYGTALELDMVQDGVVEVMLEILEYREER